MRDIGLVMFRVMNLQGRSIDVRFERVVGVGQRSQGKWIGLCFSVCADHGKSLSRSINCRGDGSIEG